MSSCSVASRRFLNLGGERARQPEGGLSESSQLRPDKSSDILLLRLPGSPNPVAIVRTTSPSQPPGSPGGGLAGGCSTAHLNLSEVFGSTRHTSVANVT